MKVCIFAADSNGSFPVPAVKGGAVQILVEHLIEQNSISKECDLTIVSFYDEEAFSKSKNYLNAEFIWIKPSKVIKLLDILLFNFIKIFYKDKKANSYKTLFSLIFYINKSSKILKKQKFDKVVLENNIPLALIIKKSHYQGEYYYHLHNIPRVNLNCNNVFENCNGYLCVSDFVGNEIASDKNPIGPVNREKIHTLYNCINTQSFRINKDPIFLRSLKEKYNIKDDEKILIFVGRLSVEKGIDKVLEALKLIADEKFKLLIIGGVMHSSNSKDAFQKKLYDYINDELKDKIIFTGYINQSELPKYYNAADIAIMPSMWDEPAGLTMIEALSCGLSLITTNSGGIPEYVSDFAVVLNRDKDLANNLAFNIKQLMNSPVKNSNMNLIYDKYSVDGYMKRFLEKIK